MTYFGRSLVEQKRLQWAREREEMIGLCGLWGNVDKPTRETPVPVQMRRNSLLPPIEARRDEQRAEESETSGYISDSPLHDTDTLPENQPWSAHRSIENYWLDKKTQKNLKNELRLRESPDSALSTPEDRLKWGDRGVGVGHLWEPVVEIPDSRLPQVFEAYRATPRWVEKGLKLSNGNSADILYIQHEDEERTKFLLGQNVPLPPEVLEERERKRLKALDHQNAIRKQLEERDRKRKEERENRLREERLEEERIQREQELERRRLEEEHRKNKEKENIEKRKEEAMKEAIEAAEKKARENKKRQKAEELNKVNNRLRPQRQTQQPQKQQREVAEEPQKIVKDSSCQSESECSRIDSSSQSENFGFLSMPPDRGLALVLDGVQDAVQFALLMPQNQEPRVVTPSRLRNVRLVTDAATQTSRKCCSDALNSVRSRKSTRRSGEVSARSDSSEKSASLERIHNCHASCSLSSKQRSRSQPRLTLGDRPKWGINRPTVQYLKQSEKDPHYLRRLKRRGRKSKEKNIQIVEKLLDSEFQLLGFQTDEDMDEKKDFELEKEEGSSEISETKSSVIQNKEEGSTEISERKTSVIQKKEEGSTKISERKTSVIQNNDDRILDILEHGFRMVSNPSSPRFVPISNHSSNNTDSDEVLTVEKNYSVAKDDQSCEEDVRFITESNDEADLTAEKEESSGIDDQSVLDNSRFVTALNDKVDRSGTVSEILVQSVFQREEKVTSAWVEETSYTEVFSEVTIMSEEKINSDTTELPELLPEVLIETCENEPGLRDSTSDNILDDDRGLGDESSSPPSSGRSEPKGNSDDADEDTDTSEKRSRGSSALVAKEDHVISKIIALKEGLRKLQMEDDSRCSSPLSLLSLPDEIEEIH